MRRFAIKKPTNDSDGSCLARLVAQLQTGDSAALGQLYDATVGRVYALAHRIAGNRADAEEVTCDVYRHVWHNAKQFDSSRGSPLSWIMIIARNCAIDCCRRRRGPREVPNGAQSEQRHLADSAPTAEDLLYQFQRGTRVRAALASLNATQAMLISLAFF